MAGSRQGRSSATPLRRSGSHVISIGQRIRVNGDTFENDLFIFGAVFLVHLDRFHLVEGAAFLGAIDHPSKDCVLPIQVRSLFEGDEKLTGVRPGTFVRHRNHSSTTMTQGGHLDLVFKVVSPY